MPSKKRFLLAILFVLLAVALTIWFAPILVASGLRLWVSWKASQEKLTVKIDQIEAPFLKPVVMRGIRVTSAPDAALRIDAVASQATLELNLGAVLLRMRGRAIQTLSVDGLRAEVHRNETGTPVSQGGWNTLQKLLPNNFKLERLDLRVENGATVVLLRNASISASEIEAGRFQAGEVMITSPWLRQTFSDLRGATNWQDDRLIIAGLTLTNGLDLQSFATDLSHLGKQHLGFEFDLDVFGGKVRASISNEWHSHHSNWNVVGSAADISLAKTSEAIGLADRPDGLLHACKFTFRGDPRDTTSATASVWAELTGLKWRERAAETIMFGAALYNRQIQLQQLYVKQSKNQLTLSGEGAFPTNQSGWFNPNFRGDISASIGNLGDFAGLFGANPGDFAGEIAIDGTMNAGDRKIGGHLVATGKSLSIFKSPIDSLAAKLNLKATELEIEQLELHRGNDFARAAGKIDIAHEHEYSGTSSFTAGNIADYVHLLPFSWSSALRQGTFSCDWSGKGKTTSHSGALQIKGRGIRISAPAELSPFDAELDTAYSPGNVFFRQLHLTNEHASVNGFLTVAEKYLQVQALAIDLNGKPQLRGNVFLPIALSKIEQDHGILDALDPDQKIDFDLNVEPTDLAELSRALTGRVTLSGLFGARFSIFGGLDALHGWGELHLRDVAVPNDPARVSADVQTRLTSGTMNTKTAVQFPDCDPVSCDISLPIRLGKERNKTASEPMTANIDFPKILVGRLPHYLSYDLFRDGILSGKLSISETLQHPKIAGSLQLTKGQLGNTPLRATDASGRITFKGDTASIDSATISAKDADLSFRGEIDLRDTANVTISLVGVRPLFALTPAGVFKCVSEITFVPSSGFQTSGALVDEIQLFGSLFSRDWTGALSRRRSSSTSGQVDENWPFEFCSDHGPQHETLVFGSESIRPTATPRPRKRGKQR